MKFRKRAVQVEATQWFQNGDHPGDQCDSFQVDGERVLSEGRIVRRYRYAIASENLMGMPCKYCELPMNNHGWIQTFKGVHLEGGHIVCPGDWIITGVGGEHYPCKPSVFAQTYEKAE